MLKQQTVPTSLGQLTVSSLTLGELRELDNLFQQQSAEVEQKKASISSLLKYLPVVHASARKVHQDISAEQFENGLTFEDFNALFNAVLEVSGLKKSEKPAGEPTPIQA
jgi:hypothetical protein